MTIATSCLEQSVDKSINDNNARLDHCDATASRARFGVPQFNCFTAPHLGSNTNQHVDWSVGGIYFKPSRSVYAPNIIPSTQLRLSKYRGSDNAQWISMNEMAATPGSTRTFFSETIENFWVSRYNGNNDRAARALFVKHRWAQGEWLRFDCIIRPKPSGASQTKLVQPRSLSPKTTSSKTKIIHHCVLKTFQHRRLSNLKRLRDQGQEIV